MKGAVKRNANNLRRYLKCVIVRGAVVAFMLSQMSCATNTKEVGTGMLVGGVVGAGVGYQFVHHGQNREYEEENTIITSIVFALVTGGVLAWHYSEVREMKTELSGRYARYRLCDPEDIDSELARELKLGQKNKEQVYQLVEDQIGDLAISLDDNTKWVYPSFRKRYLQPQQGEKEVMSERYVWEIVKPGRFVTRSQNPDYFSQTEAKDKSKNEDKKQEEKSKP